MGATYDQLDLDERIEMSRLYEAGTSRREIGRIIGRSASTVGRFVMDIADEVTIMTELRERLSGVAFPQHVIDMPYTTGKVIVPTAHWTFDLADVRDFLGQHHNFAAQGLGAGRPPPSP